MLAELTGSQVPVIIVVAGIALYGVFRLWLLAQRNKPKRPKAANYYHKN